MCARSNFLSSSQVHTHVIHSCRKCDPTWSGCGRNGCVNTATRRTQLLSQGSPYEADFLDATRLNALGSWTDSAASERPCKQSISSSCLRRFCAVSFKRSASKSEMRYRFPSAKLHRPCAFTPDVKISTRTLPVLANSC